MEEEHKESHTISCSIDVETLSSSIAEVLQDDNELDMSYGDIEEMIRKYVSSNNCYTEVDVIVEIDYNTKEIIEIRGA